MEKVNINKKLSSFNELWSPRIIGELNNQYVKVAKLKGEFIWHHHEKEDELFLVLKGNLTIQLRNKEIQLSEGEFFIVPKKTDHKTIAKKETHVLLFEPKTTLTRGSETQDKKNKS